MDTRCVLRFEISDINATTDMWQQEKAVSPTPPWLHCDPYLFVEGTFVTFATPCFHCDLIYMYTQRWQNKTNPRQFEFNGREKNKRLGRLKLNSSYFVQYPQAPDVWFPWHHMTISGLTPGSVKQFVIYNLPSGICAHMYVLSYSPIYRSILSLHTRYITLELNCSMKDESTAFYDHWMSDSLTMLSLLTCCVTTVKHANGPGAL